MNTALLINVTKTSLVNIELALHRALANNEFILHYQPKVNLTTGKIVGAEALIRWNDPSGELRFPHYFLPIAEQSDLIISMGEWVLREVCQQIKNDDFAIPISLNLSVNQFKKKGGFLEFVTQTINEFGIDPKKLEFEVTESILIKGSEIVGILKHFENMGVKIAFDDFGMKYCSLTYLRNYTPGRIKIDKSFVDGVPHVNANVAIIKSIVALCKSLGIAITAEGAETVEQVRFLLDQQCDELQSYYISKAVPASQFKDLLNNDYTSLIAAAQKI